MTACTVPPVRFDSQWPRLYVCSQGSARSRQQDWTPDDANGARGPPRKFVDVGLPLYPAPVSHPRWWGSCYCQGCSGSFSPPGWWISFSVKERVRLESLPSRLCSGLRSVRTRSGSASHRCVWRIGQPPGSDLASPWGGGLDSVSLLIEEYQTGGKSQYESIKKAGQKKICQVRDTQV